MTTSGSINSDLVQHPPPKVYYNARGAPVSPHSFYFHALHGKELRNSFHKSGKTLRISNGTTVIINGPNISDGTTNRNIPRDTGPLVLKGPSGRTCDSDGINCELHSAIIVEDGAHLEVRHDVTVVAGQDSTTTSTNVSGYAINCRGNNAQVVLGGGRGDDGGDDDATGNVQVRGADGPFHETILVQEGCSLVVDQGASVTAGHKGTAIKIGDLGFGRWWPNWHKYLTIKDGSIITTVDGTGVYVRDPSVVLITGGTFNTSCPSSTNPNLFCNAICVSDESRVDICGGRFTPNSIFVLSYSNDMNIYGHDLKIQKDNTSENDSDSDQYRYMYRLTGTLCDGNTIDVLLNQKYSSNMPNLIQDGCKDIPESAHDVSPPVPPKISSEPYNSEKGGHSKSVVSTSGVDVLSSSSYDSTGIGHYNTSSAASSSTSVSSTVSSSSRADMVWILLVPAMVLLAACLFLRIVHKVILRTRRNVENTNKTSFLSLHTKGSSESSDEEDLELDEDSSANEVTSDF